MNALETLVAEHRRIEQALAALEALAAAARDDSPNPKQLSDLVAFFRLYADAYHHSKEEDVLFEAMHRAGFSRQQGPIPVMLHEHEQGRALVGRLDSLARENQWDAATRDELLATASDFSHLLRAHIEKEDQILYPMAQARLSPAAMAEVDRACARISAPDSSAWGGSD
jgi:hemerythrin-like domain-containing protein